MSVTQNGNPERYQRLLEDGLKGARLKHLIVAQKLADAFWPCELADALRRRDTAVIMAKAGLNPDQADKVVAALFSSPLLFDLETVELLDLPRIELKDGDHYKDSLSLSTGQKCTANRRLAWVRPWQLHDRGPDLLGDAPQRQRRPDWRSQGNRGPRPWALGRWKVLGEGRHVNPADDLWRKAGILVPDERDDDLI